MWFVDSVLQITVSCLYVHTLEAKSKRSYLLLVSKRCQSLTP